MTVSAFAPYSLSAFNASQASENKIHDDVVAARLGFAPRGRPGQEADGSDLGPVTSRE